MFPPHRPHQARPKRRPPPTAAPARAHDAPFAVPRPRRRHATPIAPRRAPPRDAPTPSHAPTHATPRSVKLSRRLGAPIRLAVAVLVSASGGRVGASGGEWGRVARGHEASKSGPAVASCTPPPRPRWSLKGRPRGSWGGAPRRRPWFLLGRRFVGLRVCAGGARV